VSTRNLVDAPEQRSARRRLRPTVRSPGPLFLGFAYESWSASQDWADEAPLPTDRWRGLEIRLSCLNFAMSALEAHTVAVHQVFFAGSMPRRQVAEWRRRPLVERMADLLPKKVHSARRQRLLQDVIDLVEHVRQPPPFQVAEQIDLFERPERPSGTEFWYGKSVWVRSPPPHEVNETDERYRPSDLPTDPLDVGRAQLSTALLIILEHLVLLDRHFKDWPEWPLTTRHENEEISVSAWFALLRSDYTGRHSAFFRRIQLDADA
jgi:hypothetical protein